MFCYLLKKSCDKFSKILRRPGMGTPPQDAPKRPTHLSVRPILNPLGAADASQNISSWINNKSMQELERFVFSLFSVYNDREIEKMKSF